MIEVDVQYVNCQELWLLGCLRVLRYDNSFPDKFAAKDERPPITTSRHPHTQTREVNL